MGDITLDAYDPGTKVTLRSSLVRVQWARISPIQHRHVAKSGRAYVYQIHTNREQLIALAFDDLHEADEGSYSGLTTFRAFHEETINYSASSFALTDADGDVWTVRYWEGIETLREAEGASRGFETWSGRLTYRKTL